MAPTSLLHSLDSVSASHLGLSCLNQVLEWQLLSPVCLHAQSTVQWVAPTIETAQSTISVKVFTFQHCVSPDKGPAHITRSGSAMPNSLTTDVIKKEGSSCINPPAAAIPEEPNHTRMGSPTLCGIYWLCANQLLNMPEKGHLPWTYLHAAQRKEIS